MNRPHKKNIANKPSMLFFSLLIFVDAKQNKIIIDALMSQAAKKLPEPSRFSKINYKRRKNPAKNPKQKTH